MESGRKADQPRVEERQEEVGGRQQERCRHTRSPFSPKGNNTRQEQGDAQIVGNANSPDLQLQCFCYRNVAAQNATFFSVLKTDQEGLVFYYRCAARYSAQCIELLHCTMGFAL